MANNFSVGDAWNGYLTNLSGEFNEKVISLNKEVQEALDKLTGDSSDPVILAKYQSLASDYQVYRQTQSGVVKSYKDVATSIIANFR
ncbi:type III secretion system needle filament subunit SctF [Winslowiella iniecta]|uniref:Type III secretion system needle complex protein PrgI n=1 Tax=Winslowiella iniecta TaxID=1560201 RepID=A0A0L7TGF3_9GAMM|nr:type III secretion system needle filament subunit SctF [Winslowiella iniecta]KOC91612.1 type III secretion system needle complex protein PrgI [Winslowiella iniecta]KOC94437.1 type III secretion system needle complex protein PrgI [Winslowiella iniecta]